MQVRLQVRLSDDVELEGPQLDGPLPEAQRTALAAMYYLAGTVWLEHEGQPPIKILDDLEQLVPRLCIWSRPPLAAGQAVTVKMYISEQSVTLEPQGDTLKATTTWGVEALLPTAACISELRRCGYEYVAFVERNLGDQPAWREAADDLRQALREVDPDAAQPAERQPPEPFPLSEEELREIMAAQEQES